LHRFLVVAVGCILFTSVVALLEQRQPPAEQIAAGMAGESWFRIQLAHEHVGYMYTNTYADRQGAWHFVTTTHFLLQDNAPNTIVKHLVFDAQPPHILRQALYTSENKHEASLTKIDWIESGYKASLHRGNQVSQVELDWTYTLETFLGFELWLKSVRPGADSKHGTKSIDFERLRITLRNYRIVEENELGYLVETNAPFAATQTQLNQQMQPVRLNMAGIFDVIATDEADAIALQQLRRKTNYLFPVDERLQDHTEIATLSLRINKPPSLKLPNKLYLSANPITSDGNVDQFMGEELRYPITHPSIQALVQQSLEQQGETSRNLVAALVTTTHNQLEYAEDRPAGAVLTALSEGRGECTDYADLFTTLARAAGYPARTVYGLAYKDGFNPAFMFHAWNEVYSDGQWQAVDPTWDQTKVDATHIPLTDAQAGLMMLANNTGSVTFSVLGHSYF